MLGRCQGGRWGAQVQTCRSNTHEAPELFAATPPIESLKYIMRRAAQDKALSIMHADATRVYFYTLATIGIDVRLLVGDQSEGVGHMCNKSRKAMHSTRDAAQHWQRSCSGMVRDLDVVSGKVSS